MSVSSVKRCLWGTNNPNMEETGILEKITRSGFCYPALNQVGFSGNSTDRPRASRVELACQQLSGSFSLWLRAMAPLQRPVIEEEMQSAQISSATHWRRRQK